MASIDMIQEATKKASSLEKSIIWVKIGDLQNRNQFAEKSKAFVFSAAAPNAPQFDAEKAKVVERNLILLHNSRK